MKKTETNKNGTGADGFRQLTIWDVIQQCEHPTYSVKSLFAGCGSRIHAGMYEAIKQLYQIENVIKEVSNALREEVDSSTVAKFATVQGQYEMNVPNYWVTG